MLSKEVLSEGVQEFLEYSLSESAQIRHSQYEIYEWTEDGRITSTLTVAVPLAREWLKDPPEKASKIKNLMEALVSDNDIPLIQSHSSAARAFNSLIREIRIETNRGENDELRNDPDFFDAVHSNEVSIEFLAPIIGLSFERSVQVDNRLQIRRISDFEKELMLNARDLGGGSVAVRRAIKIGNLTHAAVYRVPTTLEDGWDGGMSVFSDIGREAQEALGNLEVAIRLLHSSRFQMGIWHVLDRTFYPTVFSSHEKHGLGTQSSVTETETISDVDSLPYYYQLVSEVNEDEGVRIAIDRLESSYRKISNADCIVDAVIGIEALLSSGPGDTFREVRRRAAVLSRDKATYSELGRLQNIRNSTVHGKETQVDRADIQQARDLLSSIIVRIINQTAEHNLSRKDLIEELDSAIERVIENEFDQLLSEFESR